MSLKLGHFEFESNLRAKRHWSDARLFRSEYYSHFVWGRLSVLWGRPGLTPITVCAACHEEISRVGEDALDWCGGCQSLEQPTLQITSAEYEAIHA